MKPSMRDEVRLDMPVLDENGNPELDRYGRPQTDTRVSRARVQYRTRTLYDQNGIAYEVIAEIDLPPDVPVRQGGSVTFTNAFQEEETKNIVGIDTAYNFAGSRVYYRTVYVGNG